MAEWDRNKVSPSEINNGKQFTRDDDLTVQELNAMVNNSFYGVDFAENMADQPDISEINSSGSPEVSIIDNVKNGITYKKFKFKNLKGEKGADGIIGKDGKSAYEYAKDGGYTGTEEKFATELNNIASNNLSSRVSTNEDNIEDLERNKVDKSTKINSKTLTSDIYLTYSDVGALSKDTKYVSSVNGNNGAISGLATESYVREVAAGKTAAFPVSAEINTFFNSQEDVVKTTSTTFTTATNKIIDISSLLIGDTIYIIETNLPDRWFSGISTEADGNDYAIFRKLETAKVPVSDVQINGESIVNNEVANIPLASSDNVGVVKSDNSTVSIDNNGVIKVNKENVVTLYGETGQNTDGAMTQKTVSDLISNVNTQLSDQDNKLDSVELISNMNKENISSLITTTSNLNTEVNKRPTKPNIVAEGTIPKFDANGNLLDSGYTADQLVNVNPDWSQEDSSKQDYIKNKIPYYTTSNVNERVFLGGTSTTASSTLDKIVNLSNYDKYQIGDIIEVTFENATSEYESGQVTLNVNNLGALPAVILTFTDGKTKKCSWGKNATIRFKFYANQWVQVTNSYGYSSVSKYAEQTFNALEMEDKTYGSTLSFNGKDNRTLKGNYVTTFTNEDISGKKNFTETPTINNSDIVSKADIGSPTNLGVVKPDGYSITVDEDGTIHSAGGSSVSVTLYDAIGQNVDGAMTQKAVTDELQNFKVINVTLSTSTSTFAYYNIDKTYEELTINGAEFVIRFNSTPNYSSSVGLIDKNGGIHHIYQQSYLQGVGYTSNYIDLASETFKTGDLVRIKYSTGLKSNTNSTVNGFVAIENITNSYYYGTSASVITENYLSEYSDKPVTNRAITTEFNKRPTYVETEEVTITVNRLLDLIYPINSIRMSDNGNEQNFMGGTWIITGQGRTIIGAGVLGDNQYTVGDLIPAGLPNITGEGYFSTTIGFGSSDQTNWKGALNYAAKTTANYFDYGSSSASRNAGLSIDASKSNPIYGKSNTVHMNSFVTYIYKRIG